MSATTMSRSGFLSLLAGALLARVRSGTPDEPAAIVGHPPFSGGQITITIHGASGDTDTQRLLYTELARRSSRSAR